MMLVRPPSWSGSRQNKTLEDHFNLGLLDDNGIDMLIDALNTWKAQGY